MTHPTDPSVIAGKLSVSQRQSLLMASVRSATAYGNNGYEPYGRGVVGLRNKGLADHKFWRSISGNGRWGNILTPLGEQVRAHLLEQPK